MENAWHFFAPLTFLFRDKWWKLVQRQPNGKKQQKTAPSFKNQVCFSNPVLNI